MAEPDEAVTLNDLADLYPDTELCIEVDRLPDGTLRFMPDGTDRLIVHTFDHSGKRKNNIGRH